MIDLDEFLPPAPFYCDVCGEAMPEEPKRRGPRRRRHPVCRNLAKAQRIKERRESGEAA